MRYLLIMLLGLLPVLAGAVEFDATTRQLPLGKANPVNRDKDAIAARGLLSTPGFSLFHPHQADCLSAGYSPSVLWRRVCLR